jgi:hypothetical protein
VLTVVVPAVKAIVQIGLFFGAGAALVVGMLGVR